jgi:hypothetical protein
MTVRRRKQDLISCFKAYKFKAGLVLIEVVFFASNEPDVDDPGWMVWSNATYRR